MWVFIIIIIITGNLLNPNINYSPSSERRKKMREKGCSYFSGHARGYKALDSFDSTISEDHNKHSEELESKKYLCTKFSTSQKQFLKYIIHETNTPVSKIMGKWNAIEK